MSNTTGVLNGTLVAQRTLETLLIKFPMLSRIATDFTAEGAFWNQVINTRVITAPTTATDYDTTTGYVASDRAVVDVNITINNHKHHSYAVNDQERSSTSRRMINEWALSGAYIIGKSMMDELIKLVTIANFSNGIIKAVGSFDRGVLVDFKTDLDLRGVPDTERFFLTNASYNGALLKDTTIVANYANPDTKSTTAVLPSVHGFDILEYATFTSPTSDAPGGGSSLTTESLVGFAGVREGLVIAARLPEIPSGEVMIPGTITNVTDPAGSGLSLQMREFYDIKLGKHQRTYTLMFGVAKGVTDNVTRLQSAAQVVGA